MKQQNNLRALIGWQDAVDVAHAKLELAHARGDYLPEPEFERCITILKQGHLIGVRPREDAIARYSHLYDQIDRSH